MKQAKKFWESKKREFLVHFLKNWDQDINREKNAEILKKDIVILWNEIRKVKGSQKEQVTQSG